MDLDGTLAYYDGWKGPDHIGEPIPAMVEKVKEVLADGTNVRIFTARVCPEGRSSGEVAEQCALIRAWCEKHLGVALRVTNEKDFHMIELWDDRCRQVVANTGEFVA